jgi:hypothetical protein
MIAFLITILLEKFGRRSARPSKVTSRRHQSAIDRRS